MQFAAKGCKGGSIVEIVNLFEKEPIAGDTNSLNRGRIPGHLITILHWAEITKLTDFMDVSLGPCAGMHPLNTK